MKKKLGIYLVAAAVVVLIGLGLLLYLWFFEGEAPQISISPKVEYVGKEVAFKIEASDSKRGLRKVVFKLTQGSKEKVLFAETLGALKTYEKEFILKPLELGLSQGKIQLELAAYDNSMRNGGEGNLTTIRLEAIVDTTPPSVTPVSPFHYYNEGGTGVVVYKASEDVVETGVKTSDTFFKAYKVEPQGNIWICFFSIGEGDRSGKKFYLYAKDRAQNMTNSSFNYQIRPKRFRSDTITVSDGFINTILPYFESIGIPSKGSFLEWFKHINTVEREADEKKFKELAQDTSQTALWKGPWLRQKNSKPMAGFGDRRTYRYQGSLVGESVHKGIDLASLQNSPVEASNGGRVVFVGDMGIYGKTIVIDHGQGIHSTYSHLSEIKVKVGEEVEKGHIIGTTGSTGLAGGDHLHFGIMVQGEFVNPIEFWDLLWIKEKITRWIEKG